VPITYRLFLKKKIVFLSPSFSFFLFFPLFFLLLFSDLLNFAVEVNKDGEVNEVNKRSKKGAKEAEIGASKRRLSGGGTVDPFCVCYTNCIYQSCLITVTTEPRSCSTGKKK
jgi:hypothetical protein